MKSLYLSCAIMALFIIGCSKPNPEKTAARATAPASKLPMALFPKATLQIEKKGVRACAVSVDFSRWPNTSEWSRLACGIEFTYYDARIEYIGHGTRGDKYRITLLQPYPEGLKDSDAVPSVYDEEVEYDGAPLKIYEVAGVTYTLKE